MLCQFCWPLSIIIWYYTLMIDLLFKISQIVNQLFSTEIHRKTVYRFVVLLKLVITIILTVEKVSKVRELVFATDISMVLGRVFLVNPIGIWRHSYIPLRENVSAGRVLQYCRLPMPDDLCPTCCPSRLLTLPPPLDGCDKTPAVLVNTSSKTMASIVFNSIIGK